MTNKLPGNSHLGAAVAEARARYTAKRPESAALRQAAVCVLPGGNTRSVLNYAPFPTAMARGEGSRLWDIDGNAYVDFCGEYTAGLFGHSDRTIVGALQAALDGGLNLAAVGEAETRLAQILCERFPSLDKVRFTNSGTEANLMAITAARAFTGRNRLIVFRGGYHGSVLIFPLVGSSPLTAPFDFVLETYNDVAGAQNAIRRTGDSLAAVVVEPMLGSGGCIPASREFLTALRTGTDDVGALLIFDEVMTSRMSAGGQQARLGILPDLTTMGKYMAGGMSFGAFGGRDDVMDLFSRDLPHAGTFNNNVMSMAGGVAGLGSVFTPDVADAFFDKGEALRTQMNALCERLAPTVQFTGLGSLMAIHFRPGRIASPSAPTAVEESLRELFFFDMLDAGIYLARRGMVSLSLPVTEADANRLVDAFSAFLRQRADLLAEA